MMKRYGLLCMAMLCWLSLTSTGVAQERTTIKMMSLLHSGYQSDELRMIARVFTELSDIDVSIDYFAHADLYEKIVTDGETYDVIAVDQIWVADLAAQGVLAPIGDRMTKNMKDDILPVIRKAFQAQRQTWACPFLINYQLFYYNQALLKKAGLKSPPKTLEQLVEQMITLKEQGIVEYPWTDSWQQGEGVVADFVWLTAAFGGDLFTKTGEPVFDQAPGQKAVRFMLRLLKEQLAAPTCLSNGEVAASTEFIRGQAAFTSNWLFLQGAMDDAKVSTIGNQGRMALLPVSEKVDQPTVSVSGFQGLAITSGSAQKEAAWKWIRFLTSPLVQRAYLIEMPIWNSVQTSQDVMSLDPTMKLKRTQLEQVRHRPQVQHYAEISAILQQNIYAALQEQVSPEAALKQARLDIETLLTSKQ